jgi:hypothetical protein
MIGSAVVNSARVDTKVGFLLSTEISHLWKIEIESSKKGEIPSFSSKR